MLEGLKYFKENFCKKAKPEEHKEKQKLMKDFMLKLTQDNNILKKGFLKVLKELQEEKSKHGQHDSLEWDNIILRNRIQALER